MNHLIVPYSLALLAKEKGFDEKCFCIYNEHVNNRLELLGGTYQNSLAYKDQLAAPLYQQLVDWFRDRGVWVEVQVMWAEQNDFKVDYAWFIYVVRDGKLVEANREEFDLPNYYTALTAALTEAFDLIEKVTE